MTTIATSKTNHHPNQYHHLKTKQKYDCFKYIETATADESFVDENSNENVIAKIAAAFYFLQNKDVHQMQTNKSLKMTKMTKKHLTYIKKTTTTKIIQTNKNINNVKFKWQTLPI